MKSIQSTRMDFLIRKFKEDSIEYRNIEVSDDYSEKRKILRSFMNISMPESISEEILQVQDEFLQEENVEKGIVLLENIPTIKEQYGSNTEFAEKISIWQGDITRLQVDAIVNAANSQMLGCFTPCHRCIDNAIHSAAGMELRKECSDIMSRKRIQYGAYYKEPTGKAIITKGYNLPSKYVIHTVGPIVEYKLTDSLKQDLKNCYESIMKCVVESNIKGVAFCCISTGEFHFPNDEAAIIAINTVREFLQNNENSIERVIFNVYKDIDRQLYEAYLMQ